MGVQAQTIPWTERIIMQKSLLVVVIVSLFIGASTLSYAQEARHGWDFGPRPGIGMIVDAQYLNRVGVIGAFGEHANEMAVEYSRILFGHRPAFGLTGGLGLGGRNGGDSSVSGGYRLFSLVDVSLPPWDGDSRFVLSAGGGLEDERNEAKLYPFALARCAFRLSFGNTGFYWEVNIAGEYVRWRPDPVKAPGFVFDPQLGGGFGAAF